MAGSSKSASYPAPEWWLELAHPAVIDDVAKEGNSMEKLAVRLSKAIGRTSNWTHSPISLFIATRSAPLDLTLAISKVFGIPPPIHVPRSLRESMKMQTVKEEFDVIHAAQAARGPGTVSPIAPKHAESVAPQRARRRARSAAKH